MIKKILLIFAALVAALVVVIALQPSDFRVTRSAVLPGSPETVFEHVNDLRKWEGWSPWAKLDPDSTATFAGPASGTGSSMTWSGNNDVGEGTMTITESKPGERIEMRLAFVRPFEGVSTTEFTFVPDAGGTLVTWTMSGTNDFVAKAIGLVMDCDKMVGGEFEKGLENLKKVVPGSR
ncbi:MAG: SRPBCC family protein [Chthoniobacterales bacterium]|nr:SRPBCC family protein [Chthoniobacterales bacterium]